MAKRGAPFRAGSARCAGDPRGPARLLLAGLALLGAARARAPGDGGFSLHPPYFNLAEGARIAASATCGEEAPARGPPRPTEDLYCKLVGGPVAGGDPSQTIQGQYCDICTAANSNKAHPASNAIDGTERWWQSPPLSRGLEYNEVNVTLDLGQVFHVAYVLIKFANSPRPDLWVLERSTDFGHTYQPWQFFASSKRDCLERFGPRTLERITQDDDVICTTEYSRIVPLENGEIVVSLVNGRPGAMNFSYSPRLRDFTKATNVRLRFLRTNTLLGHLMGKALRDPTVTRRYYYSIKDISVGGRCVCHGHADVCDAKDPLDPFRLQCACQHNTCGGSCDRCCPGFNQQPWKPATTDSANECQSCNCHGHAHDCYYDPEVDRRNASQNQDNVYQGGGVCIDCQHHTTGINCERCLPGFYRSPDQPLDSPHACLRCSCESAFTDGTCEDLTGRCYCRPNFTGERCDACAEGFVVFPQCSPLPSAHNDSREQVLPAGQIVHCDCSAGGTQGNSCRKDPRVGRCVCKPNFQGAHCELCAPGFYGPSCQPCQCTSPGVADGLCDPDSGQCRCRIGFEGAACDRCAPGYFRFPLCQLCGCSPVGTLPEGCDEAGRCPCRPGFDGPYCDHCRPGHHGYPNCQACTCDPRGALEQFCGVGGSCLCRPGYAGAACQECSPGFHGFPACTPCHCSTDGSLNSACDPRTGQCSCRPRVTGLRCDMCVPGAYNFPSCEAGSCHPAGLAPANPTLPEGPCVCRAHVEGPSCDRCKPGFWGLSPSNPEGCTRCSCDPRGTLGGVSECQPGSGQCFCKPHVCGLSCAACKEGFFGLDQADYFGCHSCRCDVGGALGQGCDPRTGACRCRPNTQGPTCSEPVKDHYLPDLHHLRLELEEAATPEGHAVRFGFNPLEFENFSWRGYAHMAPIQPRIVARLNITSPDLFRLVFRYVNRGPTSVSGRVSMREDSKFATCTNCTEQSQPVAFPPSTEPAFVTVPQRGFGEPFVLNPGTWALLVEAEGVLLDYVVLLPSVYYEAALLQLRVTEACTYRPSARRSGENCLLYAHLPLDGFPSAAGPEALCGHDNSLPRPCPTEQLSPSHPPLAACLGSDVDVQLQVTVPRPGHYALVVEYANEDARQEVGVAVHTPQQPPQLGVITLHPCPYSTLCRGPVLDAQHHTATFSLDSEASVRLTAEQAHFFLHGVTLVPAEEFSAEFVEPRVRCVSSHGTFGPGSASCLPSRFPKPPQPIILRDCQVLPLPPSLPLSHSQELTPGAAPAGPQPRPPTAVDPDTEPTLLRHPQGTVVFTTQVPVLGRYAFLLHGYQPAHPTFPVEVLINGGRVWQGHANASFCPHGYGCRTLVLCEGQAVLDVTDSELTVTVRVPEGRWLWLDYVLVIPEDAYSSSYLQEEPLDKSYDFISHCAAHGYHISPGSSSPFCQDAATSLSLFYNNGALPCGCHEVGATGPTCDPFGGQCPCRAHVIGRDCSRCATGYWGFPSCRPCDCGARLCDEITGQCICPPRTVPPDCLVCQPQTFGCHPLVGCEECNCSGPGVQELTDPTCDVDSGQCKCRPNVAGRRCDTCAPGFHGYPSCHPCDCHEAGTAPGVCDPLTGRCYCKENVQGPRCDQCRLGTFSLDAANPKGCTRCFCFGATENCRSSAHARREFVDMEGWTLLSADRQVMPHTHRAEAELLHADLRTLAEDSFPELYWQAPPSYLGDRVSSYGGTLRYQLHSETQRGDVFIPTESRPDVVLQGNQMSIAFLEPAYPAPGHTHRGQLLLVEENFRHVETHNPVSREELMMVLAGLEQLQIRALFSQISSSVSLHRVALEVASEMGSGPPASNVELCMCPANYRGDSCQECAPGYYRDVKGLFLGRCVPCQCHGHSDHCLPGSGVCVGCQHNTEGDRCERCRAGFVRSRPEDPSAPCVSCPCPLAVPSNNFAEGCILRGGRTQCLCRPGYTGASCERCAPGFFGNPLVLGSSCQPCDCSGNSDPNMIFSDCDPLTGACHSCLRHTTGPRCESCAPGFFGNALLPGNCTPCDCSPCGTEACDPQSGRCLCKAGVTGHRCDRCQEGHFGFEGCQGCRPCACGPAAEGSECHPQSGQCRCQPGAGGLQCHECAPGHWGLPERGCRRCQCPGGHCDPHTGRCTCPPGLSGERCDTCSQQHQVPVPGSPSSPGVHCEVCDHCVVLLLDDLERAGALFSAIREQLRGVNASSAAWAQLHRLNASITDLQDQLRSPRYQVEQQLQTLEHRSLNLEQDVQQLDSQATGAQDLAGRLLDSTEGMLGRAQTLLVTIQAVDRALSELASQVGLVSPANVSTPSGEQLRRTLAEVDKFLQEMRARDFRAPRTVAEVELAEAQRLLARVQEQLTSRWEENQVLAKHIRDGLAQHEAGLMDLREALNRAVGITREAEELNSRNQARLEEALQHKRELAQDNATLKATLEAAGRTLARVSELLQGMERAKEDLEHLAASLDGARTPLLEKIRTFSPAGSKVDLVETAEAHAEQLNQLALNLSSIILGINQDRFIQRAVEASNAYSSILKAMQAAEDSAGQAWQQASHTWETVVEQGLAARAQQLLANSSALEEAVLGQQQRLGLMRVTLQDTRTQLEDIQAAKDQLVARIQEVQAMLAMHTDETSKKLARAKAMAAEAQDTAARVQAQLQDMQRNLEQWQGQFGGLRGQDLGQVVLDAGHSVSSLEKTLPQLLAKLSLLENRGTHNASLALSASIGRVRELIAQARGAASKVRVSMKFNGRSGVQLRTPRDLADLAAYTALRFHLQSPELAPESGQEAGDRFVLYMGSRQATGDYMGVALRKQKVHWVYRLGDAGPVTLSIDEDIGEQFATISIDRTLQFGHMSVTVEEPIVQETKGDAVAPGVEGLLSLQPDDFIFYVGGYPSSFTPPAPLRFPGYVGCIELDTLNEEVVSLYNFERTFRVDTAVDRPCARSKSTGDPWLTDGSYLDGTGFAHVSFERQMSTTKRFDQELRLVSYSGIIFFLQHQGQFLCLAVRKGSLVLLYDLGAGLKEAVPMQPPPPLTTASKAIQVFLLAGSRKRMLVRVERTTVFSVEQDNTLDLATAYYLGGVPPDQLPPSLQQLFPSGGSIRGCIKGIKALGKYVDLKRLNTTGVSSGCTADLLVGRTMTFYGHGFLPLALPEVPPLTGDVYSGIGFRSTQDNGLLYHRASLDGLCQVSLQQGHVTLRLMRTELRTPGVFSDGAPHYAAFYSNASGVWLYVDDQLQQMRPHRGAPPRQHPSPPEEPPQLLLGGLSEAAASFRNFSGCISNVFVQRLQGPQRVFDLQQNLGSTNVSTGCALVPLPRASGQRARGLRAVARKASRRSRQPRQDPACMSPLHLRMTQDTFQFGGPLPSFLEFEGLLDPRRNRFRLSMLVRPRAPQGLLLLVAPLAASSPSLTLFLSHGQFVARTEGPGPRLRVQSRQRSRAGRWHTVSLRWEEGQLHLLTDGVPAWSHHHPGPSRIEVPLQPHTLFVGGLPARSPSSRLPVAAGLSGCVKRLQLDGRPVGAPTRVVGVTPCFSGPLESGLFFPGTGGVITAEPPVATLHHVRLELEVRPSTAAGLVLRLGPARGPPYLQLQVSRKQVLLQADDGEGEFSTWVTHPVALCDAQWHRLAATKDENVLRLEVDAQSNHTEGPLAAAMADGPAPLHLGGLPESGLPAYGGCMRKLLVNGSPLALTSLAGVQGAAGASGCPAT
ncbi:laminin subunit alpha-5 isoform X2 [Cavia porcellus]|uniref:laminin subunit alpha-5 isoform X2 n=1 Tax=Cavia porcellus TaxID=10141 RepID=UPI002FE27C49